MLMAEAAKLAAVEALCPTASLLGEAPFPTLAGRRVYDSQAAAPDDLDTDRPWTPVVSLHVLSSRSDDRGAPASYDDTDETAVIEAVCELAITDTDEHGVFTDAIAVSETAADARLVLAALVGQVRRILTALPEGEMFRRMVKKVSLVEAEAHALPQFGLRLHRVFLRFSCQMPNDGFPVDGGLPSRIAELAAALPDESYAKARLADLAGMFAAETRTPLSGVTIQTQDGEPIGFALSSGD